ncbi:MAG TPA: nitrogenase component 1 [Rubrobacteraceae bacterium]|jgi:light-independent protochlorophyllide reductase subunit B|nr:nitrogenase component 1 [Rubrobacteraceae bacterium]
MRVLRGVYEGPGSHGILRIAASMKGVHAVLRAYPEEWGFPALHGAWARTGEPAPVSMIPVRDRQGGAWSAEDLAREIQGVARRRPEAEALLFARSDAALLSGEGAPVVTLPENPETGRPPKLVVCDRESPDTREAEAADLALTGLVEAHAQHQPKSPEPTVNVFGPPIFGPNAAAEYDEVERVLNLVGIGVNARVPLETSVRDLSRLPRAWVNLVLYRETTELATLYLQDEFRMPRVTTPPIGSAATGAVLRAAGALCSLGSGVVRQAVRSELARTARLPWYARLAAPEDVRGRRVALFGDLTYTTGLGYTLAREVGLEVAWAGTYLRHLEKDFLLHAGTFTDEAFVEDDPEAVAARVEATGPDLLVGTHLEEEIADTSGIPFLPLLPPVVRHAFVERPLVGYAGSSTLADVLDAALRESPGGSRGEEPATRRPEWTEGALEELEDIPTSMRGRARRLAEEHARALESPEVTPEILGESRF